MSEIELGGKIKLTVPQLRVYLSCMKRLSAENRKIGLIDYPVGIEKAVEELLKCLNLPEDWVEKMDKKEEAEVRRHLPKEAEKR